MPRRIAAGTAASILLAGVLMACRSPGEPNRTLAPPSAEAPASAPAGGVAPHLQTDRPESPLPLPTATPAGY